MSEQTKQPSIPEYLQCEPRKYKVKLSHWHEGTCELEFIIIIKCTDEMLHEFNNFWSNSMSRLNDNKGDIVAVILKMIGRSVYHKCKDGNDYVSVNPEWGINSLFHEEGWLSDCFEITKVSFEDYVRDEDFEFSPVNEEQSHAK